MKGSSREALRLFHNSDMTDKPRRTPDANLHGTTMISIITIMNFFYDYILFLLLRFKNERLRRPPEVRKPCNARNGKQTDIGALIIGIGFWDTFYYNFHKESSASPPKPLLSDYEQN